MAGTPLGSQPAHLGVVDWGIGGLGLLGLLDVAIPEVAVTYWSDSGTQPYGVQQTVDLTRRLAQVVHELVALGCTEVVLACNAASTVVDRLDGLAVPVQGIIEHGVAAVPADVDGLVGVVGGRRTIAAGRYRIGLARPGRRVVSRVAQPLSGDIEAGAIASSGFERDLRRVVAPLRGADAVVLACTHYPAALSSFAAALPGTLLVDPAVHMARSLAARHGGPSAAGGGPAGDRAYLTSGDPTTLRRGARLAWGRDLPAIGVVPIS